MIKELEALHLTPAERNTPVVRRMLPGIPRPFGRRLKISLNNLACLTFYNLKRLSLSKLNVTIKKMEQWLPEASLITLACVSLVHGSHVAI